ncbi:MAG: UvrD-helicase domain-containing protein [Acholeplasmataceae bacterium]
MKTPKGNFTAAQLDAIGHPTKNIVVSAGAGSGKTRVLTERVIERLLNGASINNLLVLTFTRAAAAEMKNRIRRTLSSERYRDHPHLSDQLERLDSAMITTFDSFCLHLVKKYCDRIGLARDIAIGDEIVFSIERDRILAALFESRQAEKDQAFIDYAATYTTRNDDRIKEQVAFMSEQIRKYDLSDEELDRYFERYFTTEYYERVHADLLSEIGLLQRSMTKLFAYGKQIMETTEGKDTIDDWIRLHEDILKAKSYEAMREALSQSFRMNTVRGTDESDKRRIGAIKKRYQKIKARLKALTDKSKEDYEADIALTKPHVALLLDLTRSFNRRFRAAQDARRSYDFATVASLATRILREHEDVRLEVQANYDEILIDEYQDTSYLQDRMIRMISKDNVFIVGDLKQSIYGFRDADPELFQGRYARYRKDPDKGHAIDLNINFRSRKNVLTDINSFFSVLMDEGIGGVTYDEKQALAYGGLYDGLDPKNQVSGLSLLEIPEATIRKEANVELTAEEMHAMAIIQDIRKKMAKPHLIHDKDDRNKPLRPCRYDDFVILIDRKKDFDRYRRIFEASGLPLHIHADYSFYHNEEIMALHNMLVLIRSFRDAAFAKKHFKHAFLSVGRSFIFDFTDDDLIRTVLKLDEKSYHRQDLISLSGHTGITAMLRTLNEYADQARTMTIDTLLLSLYRRFGIVERTAKLEHVVMAERRLMFLLKKAKDLSRIGYVLDDLLDYFKYLIDEDEDIDFKGKMELEPGKVNVMTIHKSKGLEFNVVYFPMLFSRWHTNAFHDVYYDERYGFVIRAFNEGLVDTIPKELLKLKLQRKFVSEKIRLFYVALTRIKDTGILLLSPKREDDFENEAFAQEPIDISIREQFSCFEQLVYAAKGNISRDIRSASYDPDIFHDGYRKMTRTEKDIPKIETTYRYVDLDLNNDRRQDMAFSNVPSNLLTQRELASLETGTRLHEILEMIDLKADLEREFERLQLSEHEKSLLRGIKDLPFMAKIEQHIRSYKEYEFVHERNGVRRHGVIDLIVEFSDRVYVVDYKLKDIDRRYYEQQVTGYVDYLRGIVDKPIEAYLYSIIEGKYRRVVR